MANVPEIPNFVKLLHDSPYGHTHFVHFLHTYENIIFTLISTTLVSTLFALGTRKCTLIPSPLQNALEFFVDALYKLVESVLGEKHTPRYFPYLGTLFIFIFCNNLLGLLPFMKSPTSAFTTTLPLALMTFLYVQYTALTRQGLRGYLFHLAGSPRDPVSIALSPFMFVLHIIGELSRPLTLALRLFGNIFGEDIALGVFTGFGVLIVGLLLNASYVPVGLPLQLPFFFLGLLTCTVQALVFTLLSTIYFQLSLPEEGHH